MEVGQLLCTVSLTGRKQLLYGILWISGVNIHSPAMQKPGIYASMNKNPKAPAIKWLLALKAKLNFSHGCTLPQLKCCPSSAAPGAGAFGAGSLSQMVWLPKPVRHLIQGCPQAAALPCHSQIQALEGTQGPQEKTGLCLFPSEGCRKTTISCSFSVCGEKKMRNILCSRLLPGTFGVALSPIAGLAIKMLTS